MDRCLFVSHASNCILEKIIRNEHIYEKYCYECFLYFFKLFCARSITFMSNLYLWDIKIIDVSSGIFLFHDSRITLHRNSMQQLAGDFTYISHIFINLPVDYISEKKWIKTAGRMYCLRYVRRRLWILYTFSTFFVVTNTTHIIIIIISPSFSKQWKHF